MGKTLIDQTPELEDSQFEESLFPVAKEDDGEYDLAHITGPNLIRNIEDSLSRGSRLILAKATEVARSGNQYTINISDDYDPSDYAHETLISFRPTADNDGSVSVALNSLALKTLKKMDGTDYASGELPETSIVTIAFDVVNDYWITISIKGAGDAEPTAVEDIDVSGETYDGILVATTDSPADNLAQVLQKIDDFSYTDGDGININADNLISVDDDYIQGLAESAVVWLSHFSLGYVAHDALNLTDPTNHEWTSEESTGNAATVKIRAANHNRGILASMEEGALIQVRAIGGASVVGTFTITEAPASPDSTYLYQFVGEWSDTVSFNSGTYYPLYFSRPVETNLLTATEAADDSSDEFGLVSGEVLDSAVSKDRVYTHGKAIVTAGDNVTLTPDDTAMTIEVAAGRFKVDDVANTITTPDDADWVLFSDQSHTDARNVTATYSDVKEDIRPAAEDEGDVVDERPDHFNFTGTGVMVTDDGSGVEVNIPGGGGDISIQEDGSEIEAAANQLNFIGDGVTVTAGSDSAVEIEITGEPSDIQQRAETISFQASATIDQSGAVVSKNTTPLGVVYPVDATDNDIIALGENADGFTILLAGIYDITVDGIVNPSGERVTSTFDIYEYADTVGTDAPIGQTDSVYLRYDDTDIPLHEDGELIVGADNTAVKLVARNAHAGGSSGATGSTFDLSAGAVLRISRKGVRGEIGPESEFVPDLYEDYPTALTTSLGGADRIPIADTGIVGEPNRHVRIGVLQEYFADLGNRILIEEATFEDTDKFFFHDDSAGAMRYVTKSDLESELGNGGTGATYTGGQGIAISGSIITLADDGVISEKIAANAILTEHVADANITRVKIAPDTIDGTLIADDAIGNEHLGNNVVQSSNIGAAQIITSLLAANAVTTGKVGTGAVTEPKIGADAVTGIKVADDAIGIEHLNANTEISELNITDGTSNVIGTVTGRRIDLAINVLAPETQHYHIFVTRTLDSGGAGTTLSSSSHMIFYVFSGTEWDIEMFQHTDLPTNYLDHLQPGTDIRLVSGDTEWLGQITETLEASTSGAIFRINFSEQQTGSFATDDSIRISFGYAPAAITLASDGETLLGGGTLRNKFRINIDAPTSANDAQVMAWSDSDSEFVWAANAGGNGASYTQGTGIDITGLVISIADAGVDTDQIAAAAIETEQVNDDAVNLAKLAHGTANMYVGYDASGVPAELGAPVVDLYEDFPTEISTTLVAQDRMVIADVGTTDQPNRHVRLDDLGGYFADLRDRIPTGRAAVDADDRIFLSVESLSGDPMRYASAETLSNYILDLNTHFATEETYHCRHRQVLFL